MAQQQTRNRRSGSRSAVTAIRYGKMGWVGEFSYPTSMRFRSSEQVVVQTDRGTELGRILDLTCQHSEVSEQVSAEQVREYVRNSGPEYLRLRRGRVLRVASSQDIDEDRRMEGQAREELGVCREMARQRELDMHLITAEHIFGGERIIFYFSSEERVDFRPLVKELANEFQTRIEMCQIGARDEARLVGDYEICGRECCCRNFLKALKPVAMSMAKTQKATLDPGKISGRCGRLRCCLRYENECYKDLLSRLPQIGAWVRTEKGDVRVVDRQPQTQLVQVQAPGEHQRTTLSLDEILGPGEPTSAEPSRRPDPPAGRATDKRREAGTPTPLVETETPPPGADGQASADGQGPADEQASADGQQPRKRRRRRRRRRSADPAVGSDEHRPAEGDGNSGE